MKKYLKWLFWTAAYAVRRRPKDIPSFLIMASRTQLPWWTFRPYAYHNEDGNMWHVCLTGEQTYTKPRQMLEVDLHISEEDGTIVGFDVWDETLHEKDSDDL